MARLSLALLLVALIAGCGGEEVSSAADHGGVTASSPAVATGPSTPALGGAESPGLDPSPPTPALGEVGTCAEGDYGCLCLLAQSLVSSCGYEFDVNCSSSDIIESVTERCADRELGAAQCWGAISDNISYCLSLSCQDMCDYEDFVDLPRNNWNNRN